MLYSVSSGEVLTMPESWKIKVGDVTTSADLDSARADAPVVVFAHGAGGNKDDRGVVKTAGVLRDRGISVVRFNFLYSEKKSGRPDQMPRLQECFTAVVEHTRKEINPKTLIIGGRSMGGRAASMMAAENFKCDGLLLFAYPLHPPGHPEKLRDAHLPSIKVPVLCFNGTRDPFCTRDLMEKAIAPLGSRWEMDWIETADHSFHVLKSSGKTDTQVVEQMGDITRSWVTKISMR